MNLLVYSGDELVFSSDMNGIVPLMDAIDAIGLKRRMDGLSPYGESSPPCAQLVYIRFCDMPFFDVGQVDAIHQNLVACNFFFNWLHN